MTVHGSWTLDRLVEAYTQHQRRTRGLRPQTLRDRARLVRILIRAALGTDPVVWRQVLLPLNVNYSCRFGRLLVRRRTVRWALLRVLKTQKTKRRERPLGDVHGVR